MICWSLHSQIAPDNLVLVAASHYCNEYLRQINLQRREVYFDLYFGDFSPCLIVPFGLGVMVEIHYGAKLGHRREGQGWVEVSLSVLPPGHIPKDWRMAHETPHSKSTIGWDQVLKPVPLGDAADPNSSNASSKCLLRISSVLGKAELCHLGTLQIFGILGFSFNL